MTPDSSRFDLTPLRQAVAAWWQAQVGPLELDAAETLGLALGRELAHALLETALRHSAGRQSYQGTHVPCPQCGARARFVGYRDRWLRTLCGEQRVTRAYYHCAACHRGVLPWDTAAGLNERIFSPGVKALLAECCARLTHREVEALLARVLGLAVEESSQQEVVAEVGGRLRAAEAAAITASLERLEEVPAAAEPPARLYIGIDAAKAHTGGSWHDVKCAALYAGVPPPASEAGGPAAPPAGDRAGPKRYVARQEEAAAFGARVYVAACQAGLAAAGEAVVVGDGAEWIWNLAAEHFGAATQVLDYYHAAEHIWKLVPVLYAEGSAAGQRWAENRCRELEAKGPTGLLRALRRRQAKNRSQAEALRLAQSYFQKHRARMQYPAFRQRGLMIGSGPVEAACKAVVGQRLKGTGMRWSTHGADAMLAVRTAVLSGHQQQLAQAARAA